MVRGACGVGGREEIRGNEHREKGRERESLIWGKGGREEGRRERERAMES